MENQQKLKTNAGSRQVSSANGNFFKCLPKCEREEVLHVLRLTKDKRTVCADWVGMWETVKNAVATNKRAKGKENSAGQLQLPERKLNGKE